MQIANSSYADSFFTLNNLQFSFSNFQFALFLICLSHIPGWYVRSV